MKIDCGKPGIIESDIEAVAKTEEAHSKAYKICLDGKRIIVGFVSKLGEVDLYGHESKPTLQDKNKKLADELTVIQNAKHILEKSDITGKKHPQELTDSDKKLLQEHVKAII